MESLCLEEENIIKDIRNLFRLKKNKITLQLTVQENLFRKEKETKAIKDRIPRKIKNLFKHTKEEENYYKPVGVSNFWINNYIEYKSSGDKNKTLSVEEYLNKISSYLKDIIIQLTIANNFISSLGNVEECIIHSKSDNMKIMINDEADEVIGELFDSLKNRYRNNLESMKGSELVFDYVQLLS